MKKEFIPYEQALELKELGFNEDVFEWFNTETKDFCDVMKEVKSPLYQQAFRWFREKHDIQYFTYGGGYLGKVLITIKGYKHDKIYFSSSEPMEYEEAELACLKKLIEIVKNK